MIGKPWTTKSGLTMPNAVASIISIKLSPGREQCDIEYGVWPTKAARQTEAYNRFPEDTSIFVARDIVVNGIEDKWFSDYFTTAKLTPSGKNIEKQAYVLLTAKDPKLAGGANVPR
jgi:hypothetical protein